MSRPNPQGDASLQDAAASTGENLDHLNWRRVHPLTPLARTWQVFAALFAVAIWQNTDAIERAAERGVFTADNVAIWLPYVAGGLAVILVAVGLYSWAAWRRMEFAVGQQAVWFRHGIIFRSERHSRLDRIQSVDITHQLIGRIFGLGSLQIKVAGGSDSTLTIGLMTSASMVSVQQEIMDRVDGLRHLSDATGSAVQAFDEDPAALAPHASSVAGSSGSEGSSEGADPAGRAVLAGAPAGHTAAGAENAAEASTITRESGRAAAGRDRTEIPIFEVSTGRLLGSLALSGIIISLLIALAALVAAVVVFFTVPQASLGAILASAVPVTLGFFAPFWARLTKEFGFRGSLSADGIHLSHGLTATVAETIPPRRIHAVEISQPWLWRRFGWYRVEMKVAGKASGQNETESTTLLPVGTLQEALLALWLVEPDLGVADPVQTVTVGLGAGPAGDMVAAARGGGAVGAQLADRRDDSQGSDTLQGAFDGRRVLDWAATPANARVFDWLSFRRAGVVLTDRVLMIRGGRISPYISVIPLSHVQSWSVAQGPWDRQRGLALLQSDMVAGPVNTGTQHLEQGDASRVLGSLVAASLSARGGESRADWSARIQSLRSGGQHPSA